MRRRKIKFDLINGDTSIRQSVSAFIDIDDKNNCIIEIFIEPNTNKSFVSHDFFTALCRLREWLYEWKGYYPMLIGALKNVYPSRMSKQMSNGVKAYCLTFGKQAQEKDLLDIFHKVEEKDINKLSTVEEQREYYVNWLDSL